MCGISGLIAPKISTEKRKRLAEQMAEAISHRGPDDHGVWLSEPGVALSHRRLAILDLSELGHQPMTSRSQRYTIVFNGEIYNFKDLRARLERDHQQSFNGHSDTEVMLGAFEAWGIEKSLQFFNGMFAFAVWDQKNRELTLARDRLGEKPLYYGKIGDNFYFASELGAIIAAVGRGTLTIDSNAVGALLMNNCVPAPLSIFKSIYKLEPGHMLTILPDQEFAPKNSHSFWTAPAYDSEKLLPDSETTLNLIEDLLKDSVKIRMIADVPIGAFLSGGVDSSLVTALMQSQSSQPIRTYTVGFSNKNFDESQYARKIANHLKTDHTELFLSDREALEAIPKMGHIFSEPFSDSSQIPTYLISVLTQQHVKVVLSGDGGDEIFAGYNRYDTALRYWAKIQRYPYILRRLTGNTLEAVPPNLLNFSLGWLTKPLGIPNRGRSVGEKSNKLGGLIAAKDFSDFYKHLITQWQNPQQAINPRIDMSPFLQSFNQEINSQPLLRTMMKIDLHNYLPNDILAKVDRATMATSLESRIPLLDHRLVEMTARLPESFLVRNGERKWILKTILDKYIPRELIERPKMGFGVPLGDWLRGPLKDWASDLLAESHLKQQNIFTPKVVQKKWQRHINTAADYSHDLWPILMFQSWQRNWHNTLFD